MSQFTFKVNELFRNAFGFIPETQFGNLETVPGYPDEQAQSNKGSKGTGAYMWDRFKFNYVLSGEAYNGTLVSYTLPDATVVDVSCSKTIVKTQLTKVKGTVKEFINTGDWNVEFKGLMINYDSMTFPINDQNAMINFFQVNKSVKVISKLLNGYKIYNLVVESIRFPQMAGYANCQPFEISCVSDEPIILEIE